MTRCDSTKWRSRVTLLGMELLAVMGFLAAAPTDIRGSGIEALTDDGCVDFRSGDELLLRYRIAPEGRKHYVAELRIPGACSLLDDAPADHPWHHGMMFAFIVDHVNYWEEPHPAAPSGTRFGRQHLASPPVVRQPDVVARWASVAHRVDWHDDHNETQLAESRWIAVRDDPDHSDLLVTWNSQLTVAGKDGDVPIGGTHYHGVGLRFAPAFTDHVEVLLPSTADPSRVGHPVRGTEVLYDTTWCGYLARISNEDVTVAMFAVPGQGPRPTRWFTMHHPFTYLSATLGLDQQPLRLASGDQMTLTYGLAAWKSRVDAEQIGLAFDAWLAELDRLRTSMNTIP